MAIYKVSRLSLYFDGSTGRMQSLRTRPAGFWLPLFEAESYLGLPALSSKYQVGSQVETMHTPLGALTSRELLVVSTHWSDLHQEVTRTFRTLKRALSQKAEVFDFKYRLKTHQPTLTSLLRFTNYVGHESLENGFQVQTVKYRFHAVVTTAGSAQWSVESFPDSSEATLRVKVDGESELLVSFVVLSAEKQAQDPAIHLIPAPLDEFSYLLTALTPRIRESPLSPEPYLGLAVPSPTLYYMSPESRLHALYPQGNFLKRVWRRLARRNDLSVALPPRNYMLGDLIRMSDILIYNWRSDVPDLLPPIISLLRNLEENRLASLQSILVISEGASSTQYFSNLKSTVGRIQLTRLQPSTPQECSLEQRVVSHNLSNLAHAIGTLDKELDRLRWEPPFDTREAFRCAFPVKLLPPITIPATGKPADSAPFLTAARLRGSAVKIGEPRPNEDPWPLPLQGQNHEARSVEVAQFLLTDLATHETMRNMSGNQSYEATWLDQLEQLRKGQARAERVTLVSISGDAPETDRMKLLPAVLYSTQIPSPVLSFLITQKQQRSLLSKFNDYVLQGHEACLAVAKRDGTGPGQQFYDQLDKRRRALQDEFRKVLPAAYIEFLRLVRPKEVINFSSLPLDWLELDGIGLGYLSKVASIRSVRPASDLGYCADLSAAYNSLVASEIRSSRNESRALIIAPEYHEQNQGQVNEFIQSSVAGIERRLREEQSKGREIAYQIVHEATTESITELLQQDWTLVVYVGHAGNGVLSLSDGHDVAPSDLPEKAFLDTTILLIGCDTQGAANLSGSVASQFLSLGARGVFSTYFPIALGPLADNMLFNLVVYMIELNYPYGDVLALTRFSMLWEHWFLYLAQQRGERVRPEIKWLSKADTDYLNYRGEWDKFYNECLNEYRNFFEKEEPEQAKFAGGTNATIGRRAQISGLALSFTGDLHARLFDF